MSYALADYEFDNDEEIMHNARKYTYVTIIISYFKVILNSNLQEIKELVYISSCLASDVVSHTKLETFVRFSYFSSQFAHFDETSFLNASLRCILCCIYFSFKANIDFHIRIEVMELA